MRYNDNLMTRLQKTMRQKVDMRLDTARIRTEEIRHQTINATLGELAVISFSTTATPVVHTSRCKEDFQNGSKKGFVN